MRYADALRRLYALESRGIRLGASRMHAALALRGHPERGQRFVHVGGTNGKGSVSALIAASLRAGGYRTGLYTSPHLHRYVERVQIDGRPLREREAAARIEELLAAFAQPGAPELSFFELTTLLAFEAFRDHDCDLVVLEVGLGGRLDATNAITPEVSVITSVGLDHTQILGPTVARIAREKAGIIKPGVPVVVGTRDRSAWRVIAARARRVGAPALLIERDFAAQASARRGRFAVRVAEQVIEGLGTQLAGAHQRDNAACAVAALVALRAHGVALSDAVLRRGLLRARWPARLERSAGTPSFLFDAAHNIDGCKALVRHLAATRAEIEGARVLVFGAMEDKAYGAMLRVLAPHFEQIVFSPPALRRAASSGELARHARGVRANDLRTALSKARRAAGRRGEVVVAGSIFLVAAARAAVLGLRSDPLIRM